jgi:hypothetical protein
MAYGEPFAASCEVEVDYNGNSYLASHMIFKTVIFPKMCEGMDNVALLSSLYG